MNRLVLFAISLLLGYTVLSLTLFVVDQRQYAIVFAFGEIKEVISDPGLHFKLPPPFQNILFLEKRIMTIDTPNADRFITAEKKNLLVDSYVKWKIVDPKKYYMSFNGNERFAKDRMTQLIKSAQNESFTKRTVIQLVSTQRNEVMQEILAKVSNDAAQVGIKVVDVRLKRVDLVAQISESVYSRMAAERKRVANDLRATGMADAEKIRADAERQSEILLAEAYRDAQQIKGDGDAVAAQIYSKAFSQNPEFAKMWRNLEAYRAVMGKKDIMVLDFSSDFFKLIRNPAGNDLPSLSNTNNKHR